jgi:hypothetical protein
MDRETAEVIVAAAVAFLVSIMIVWAVIYVRKNRSNKVWSKLKGPAEMPPEDQRLDEFLRHPNEDDSHSRNG